jgi:conjugative relaxase-like TrwC/TraI family protein
VVGVTKIQRGNADYWLAAVAEGGEDYYTKPGEAPGEWVGQLAQELDLHGQVDAASYTAMLEGRDPTSGRQLLHRPPTRYRARPDGTERRVEPVLGYDVRFSAPKSVSLLYALGDERTRERVVAVLNEAVREGIAHLEAEACMVQRGKGGVLIEPGSGFVGMAFRHRMSRAGDPALHVHVVVSNLTRAASDGKWLSLASPQGRSPLWPHGKSAGVVFQAALRAGFLREFGLEFEEVRNGYADLRGVSREAIEGFSTRSREIAAWQERHGVWSVGAAQTAAYRTRDAKDHGVDVDERRGEWIVQAEGYGLTPAKVAGMVAAAQPREPRAVTDADLDAALTQLEETTSHFDRRAVLWAIADQLREGCGVGEIGAAADRLLASDRVVCVHRSGGPLELSHYTTPRIAELERHFLDCALREGGAGAAVVSESGVRATLERHDYLGADQREMVERLLAGGERVLAVAARPGTGKTTALAAAREAWEAEGFGVIGVATARTASGELCDAGVPATSIRALLNRAEEWRARGERLRDGTVIVLDEASTTSTFDLAALRELAVECAGKLVVIGDPRQIAAIGPGGLFAHLVKASEPVVLTTIRRQRSAVDRRLVELVHEGRGSEALDLLRTRGRLIVADDLPSALAGQLADWHRDFATGADVVMIARRNRDVDHLNEGARELRASEGTLGAAEVIVGGSAFAAGDRIQTRINTSSVSNRERWDVVAVDAAARTMTLRRLAGDERTVTLGPRYLDRETPDGAPALQHAYAITKFGAQGKTFDRVYPLLDAGASLEQELVALSRGREVANVYAVAASEWLDPDLGPAKRELSDPLHDVRVAVEREGGDWAASEVSLRRRVESMPLEELAERRAKLADARQLGAPGVTRRERVERRIAAGEERLAGLHCERESLEARGGGSPKELARLQADEATFAERLRRDYAERDSLPTPIDRPTEPSTGAGRLEAVLIEERIERLARREVLAGRLNESKPIYEALGPRPSDPQMSLLWAETAHDLAVYRCRQAVRDLDSPLGPIPSDRATRTERERAELKIEAAREKLGLSSSRERALDSNLEFGL